MLVDDDTFLKDRLRYASPAAAEPVQAPSIPQREDRYVARRGAPRARQIAIPARAAAGAGCLVGLIRWAIFIAIAFYALNALGAMPQIRQVVTAVLRGDPIDTAPMIDAFRSFLDLSPTDRRADQPRETSPRSSPPQDRADDSSPRRVYQPGEPGVTAPLLVQRVPAVYPPEALRRRIQGTVILRCVVEPDGTVSGTTVTRSIDATYGIDAEAVRAVRQWRFEPGRRDGEPARVAAIVTVTFALRGAANEPVSR